MPQRYDCKDGKDADRDEDGLHDASSDVADGHDLVLPLDDRENDNRGADVRDDEDQFQQRAEVDAVVRTGSCDVALRIVKDRLIEEKRRDRGREGDQVQHPKPQRNRSLWAHLDSPRRVIAAPILDTRTRSTTCWTGGLAPALARGPPLLAKPSPADRRGHVLRFLTIDRAVFELDHRIQVLLTADPPPRGASVKLDGHPEQR